MTSGTPTVTLNADATFELAVSEQRAGRKDRAYPLYERVLTLNPAHHQALFLLAALDLEGRRWQPAVQRLELAIELFPNNPAYFSNLGLAYRALGATEQSTAAFVRAVALNPELVEASYQLGLSLMEQGEADGARTCLTRAADLRPESFAIQHLLARALAQCKLYERAVGHFHCALALNPKAVQVYVDLMEVLVQLGRFVGANVLGRRALALDPSRTAVRGLLGFVLVEQRRFDEGIAELDRALLENPGSARTLEHLGHALRMTGRLDEAIDCYRRAIANNPRDHRTHSALIFTLAFHPDYGSREILVEARAWAEAHARGRGRFAQSHGNERSSERRLRLGYVSPNFSRHCQRHFMLPLLGAHDRSEFEVVCYSSVPRPDAMTSRHEALADLWRDVHDLDDAALAQRIHEDRIDILVDLTMHMPNHRLLAFAERPAPVQMTWLAYPGTTGLDAIDYRITDPFLDPGAGGEDALEMAASGGSQYAERSLCLPHTFWCFDPLVGEPKVGPLPALEQGYVTFGCLNEFCKVNTATLELWAQVLRAVSGSRLLLLAPLGSARERVLAVLRGRGVGADRVEFVERLEHAQYLRTYGQIDIVLDCLPYNGHTTSLDALWMGAPVVTLVGATIVGRAGLSQARNLGLSELVAETPQDFVRLAQELASDLPRLSALRETLRGRMVASPLMDVAGFARSLEAEYRRAWRYWCMTNGAARAPG